MDPLKETFAIYRAFCRNALAPCPEQDMRHRLGALAERFYQSLTTVPQEEWPFSLAMGHSFLRLGNEWPRPSAQARQVVHLTSVVMVVYLKVREKEGEKPC